MVFIQSDGRITMRNVFLRWNKISLVQQIFIGLLLGIVLAFILPESATFISIFGTLFVSSLKAVAPILVFLLVLSVIAQNQNGQQTNMKLIVPLYFIGTFLAGLVAVIISFVFPVQLTLNGAPEGFTAPAGVGEVLESVLLNIVDNPVNAISNGNYLGILAWAILFGLSLKNAPSTTKTMLSSLSEAISTIVSWIIRLAPIGIMGLVFETLSTRGLDSLLGYGHLLLVLIGTMVFVAFFVNPLIVYLLIRKNPYPLVFTCIKESGITAFFTRSSAANIPVNMRLCEKLGLDKDRYSVSIPLGATINMAGAAITISVLTLAAVHTLNIDVDLPTALILCFLAALCASGASGIAGGSLLLIPLACSLFGIPNDIAMEIVGVGFVIGVLQDSFETALNSSTDALFTAAAEFRDWRKEGKSISL